MQVKLISFITILCTFFIYLCCGQTALEDCSIQRAADRCLGSWQEGIQQVLNVHCPSDPAFLQKAGGEISCALTKMLVFSVVAIVCTALNDYSR